MRCFQHFYDWEVRWAGHLVRRDDSRVPQKVMGGRLGGRKPVGKPVCKWEVALRSDVIDLLPIRKWKAGAGNREV